MKSILEKEREIPVSDEVDVLVVGGGPAGYSAAIAAARNGAKTMIIEQQNCIGGMATAGMMSHFTGGTVAPLCDEVLARMKEQESSRFEGTQVISRLSINHEALKLAMLELLVESGVKIKLYTFASSTIVENNMVKGVIIENKSGRSAILSKVVVDCSGDGDMAASAGAEYNLGRDGDNMCQPATLMFRIGGVEYKKNVFPGSFEHTLEVPKGEIQALARQHLPHPAGHVLLYQSWLPNEVCVNMTNVTGIDGTNADDLVKAELTCRQQVSAIIKFLREFAPGYENCYLVSTAQFMGIRETRHFKCLYQINEQDIVEARVFEDWIASKNFFNFDIHSLTGAGLDKDGAQKHFQSKGKYTIPYSACVPEKIDGILLAGRSICGTHKAHSNFRVMPICMNMGHGIGVAAALAAKENILPRNVDVKKVQAVLIGNGMNVD